MCPLTHNWAISYETVQIMEANVETWTDVMMNIRRRIEGMEVKYGRRCYAQVAKSEHCALSVTCRSVLIRISHNMNVKQVKRVNASACMRNAENETAVQLHYICYQN